MGTDVVRNAILSWVVSDMGTRRTTRLAAAVVLLTALWPAGSLTAETAPSKPTQVQQNSAGSMGIRSISVEQGGLLSVDVRDAPMRDVLRVVGERAAVAITVQADADERVTQSFTNLGLEEGIRRIAQGYAVIMIWGTQGRLAEVRVYKAAVPGGGGISISAQPGTPTTPNPPVADQGSPGTTAPGTTASPPPGIVDPQAQQPQSLPQTVQDLAQRARQNDAGALAALIDMLGQSNDPAVRQDIAAALGAIGGSAAVDALTAASKDQDSTVRTRAMLALGQIGDERLAGPATDLLRNDPDPTVRRTAVWALSMLQNDDSYRTIEAATEDPDQNVRQAAADTLERWGRPLRPTFAKPPAN